SARPSCPREGINLMAAGAAGPTQRGSVMHRLGVGRARGRGAAQVDYNQISCVGQNGAKDLSSGSRIWGRAEALREDSELGGERKQVDLVGEEEEEEEFEWDVPGN
ncbi:unnamed protein product, partial [Discosporangium mesarthrocarpum]